MRHAVMTPPATAADVDGTQFRQWATNTLREYLTKGFAIDDEQLMAGRSLGADYFDAG